ncbi:uncharacterized protein E0L32_003291 [Thyridium curvatum]|uniref:Sorting nexin-4 n=1 Tax=Thyridium curvatum TaxID=1093900 RepID=A0A507BCC5_9PEZI|nr:uncharacterized protein E0L32_003291 [Thyridium curvatum]TPX17173.1 hypothetical protein E0L32_003291 [Thyridium curvatum]
MEQDNFSNISWHSEQRGEASGSSSAPQGGATILETTHGKDPDEPVPDYHRMEGTGIGGETLSCTVSSPLKENEGGGGQGYITYLITTNTTFQSFSKSTVSVRRRFTDFVFLYKTLCRDYPACAVPPLPDKQRMESYVKNSRFDNEFTSRRAHSLQRFLARCSLHPILRRAAILHQFLESPDWNATMRTRSARASTDRDRESSAFDNFADSLINAFTKVHRPDRRFIEVRERSDKLDEDLGHVEKVVARVARREADLEADLADLAEQFQKLITLEPGVEFAVHAFAASVDDTAAGLHKLKDHTDQDYLGSLRDMAAYSGALKNLLKAREQKQLDYEQLTEYLNKSTADRDMLASGYHGGGGGGAGGALAGAGSYLRGKIEDVRGVDHEQSRRERQRKLEMRIEDLTAEVERAHKTSEMFDEEVVKEVADFERIKRCEFKSQFGALADAHITFYDGVANIWERYVKEMEKDGVLVP